MKERLKVFETKSPEIVFEWCDSETTAKGWLVINSLRGGAAGGGTRMRKGLDRREVESLAKTMEIKFTVSGPAIGGGKSGIDFDPNDPRKNEVLRRWYRAVSPMLKSYYGTGGDLNVDQVQEVIPMAEAYGIWHPLQGVVAGHFPATENGRVKKLEQLKVGVKTVVADEKYAPIAGGKYLVADMITGWGVSESVRHFYEIYGGALKGKRVIVQGWGNVGSAAAYYLAQAGAVIVGIIDREGGLINRAGFGLEEVRDLFASKQSNQLRHRDMMPFDVVNEAIWSIGAEVFVPCAASRLITKDQMSQLLKAGLEVISSGANVPFADSEIFYGPIYEYADSNCSVIPDFIANCGMARAFAYLMQDDARIEDSAIFEDVSKTVGGALRKCHDRSAARTGLATVAFDLALDQVLPSKQ